VDCLQSAERSYATPGAAATGADTRERHAAVKLAVAGSATSEGSTTPENSVAQPDGRPTRPAQAPGRGVGPAHLDPEGRGHRLGRATRSRLRASCSATSRRRPGRSAH
jgi:hypothetical protein